VTTAQELIEAAEQILGPGYWLKPAPVAGILGVSRSTVYRWFDEGKMSGIKLPGGAVRLDKPGVLKILESYQEMK
jgi:excisionase family DNA binding protein